MKKGLAIIVFCLSAAGFSLWATFHINELFVLGVLGGLIMSLLGAFEIGDWERQRFAERFIKYHGEKCKYCNKKLTYEGGGWTIPTTRFALLCDDCYKKNGLGRNIFINWL